MAALILVYDDRLRITRDSIEGAVEAIANACKMAPVARGVDRQTVAARIGWNGKPYIGLHLHVSGLTFPSTPEILEVSLLERRQAYGNRANPQRIFQERTSTALRKLAGGVLA